MLCQRCDGFMVFDHFCGPVPCEGFRCINCGAITSIRVVVPARAVREAPGRPVAGQRSVGVSRHESERRRCDFSPSRGVARARGKGTGEIRA